MRQGVVGVVGVVVVVIGGCGCGGNVMCNLISLSLSLLLSLAWKLIGGAEGIFQLMPARIIIISYLHFSQMNLKRMIIPESLGL